jgi:sugar/nucleoside kinase (ribokinase family)
MDLLCSKARFLAVNTQLNAANMGFHSISKYRRADYLCVHDGEIRIDVRSRLGDMKTLVGEVAKRSSCPTVMVTRGNKGTLLYRQNVGFIESPALAAKVVDRIGAGDAVLALTAALVAAGVPDDVVGFVANVVGAEAVQIICNRTSIERIPLIKHIDSLLK